MINSKSLKLNKKELHTILALYGKQSWLTEKEQNLLDLLEMCDTETQRDLICELLGEFYFLSENSLNFYLDAISTFIVEESGFLENQTQIAAITYDDAADSSQKVLDYIKMPLFRKGWADVKTVNRYGAVSSNYGKGLNQIIFIDEFVGSGSTIVGRVKQLKNDIKESLNLKFCFIAGMEHGLNAIEDLGFEVFCPLRMKKGINGSYSGETLNTRIVDMILLEKKLAKNINIYDLSNYTFGYNYAEALYSLEGTRGNTPNSVFPIFWWPKDYQGGQRNTLLTRYEKGLK